MSELNTSTRKERIVQSFNGKVWLDYTDVSKFEGITRGALMNRVSKGKAPPFLRQGKSRLIHVEDFADWLLLKEDEKAAKKKLLSENILMSL